MGLLGPATALQLVQAQGKERGGEVIKIVEKIQNADLPLPAISPLLPYSLPPLLGTAVALRWCFMVTRKKPTGKKPTQTLSTCVSIKVRVGIQSIRVSFSCGQFLCWFILM